MFNKYNLGIHKFCDKGKRRPELEGVYFGKDESCATDSFTLVRVSYPKLDDKDFPLEEGRKVLTKFKPFILMNSEAEKILKFLPKKCAIPILENAVLIKENKENVEIGITDMGGWNVLKNRTIEGEFPDYKEILAKKEQHIKITIDVKFLKKIVDFLIDFGDSQTNGVNLEIPVDNEQPIRFYSERTETGQKCEILLMPLKSK